MATYTEPEVIESLKAYGNGNYDGIKIPFRILRNHKDFKKFRVSEYRKRPEVKERMKKYMREYNRGKILKLKKDKYEN